MKGNSGRVDNNEASKLNTLFELFPHVNCDEVRDIYEGVQNHL